VTESIYKVHIGDFFVEPRMLNHLRITHGGAMIRECDSALGLLAEKYVNGRVLTVSIRDFSFKQRTHVGDRIDFEVTMIATSTHTMTFYVNVLMLGFGRQPVSVGEGVFVFIAVDENFNPSPVPALEVHSSDQEKFIRAVRKRYGLSLDDVAAA